MTSSFEFIRTQALLGRLPRAVFDVSVKALPLDGDVLKAARERVRRAALVGEEIPDQWEGQCHELGCIEDAGLSGTFRRLLAIACLALDVDDRLGKEGSSASWPYLLATHRAVEERWIGGTYDLSNCLGTLFHRVVTPRKVETALGTWVWLNLTAGDQDPYFRWVVSTRRFEHGVGLAVLSRTRAEESESGGDRASPASEGISAADAELIAKKHLSENPHPGATGKVSTVVRWEDIRWRKPSVYGMEDGFWKRQWIVYLEQPGLGLRPSLVVAVDRMSGAVGFVGSANDEG